MVDNFADAEARLLALKNNADKAGIDFWTQRTAEILGIKPQDVTKEQRFKVKARYYYELYLVEGTLHKEKTNDQ